MARIKTDKLHQKTDPSAQGNTGASADPIVTRLANADKIPWYRKPNLRALYFLLFPTCMGIELTSGFDAQMINALQIVPSWVECEFDGPTERNVSITLGESWADLVAQFLATRRVCMLPFNAVRHLAEIRKRVIERNHFCRLLAWCHSFATSGPDRQ